MRIFVTGGTGFLGQHIVSSLLNGTHEIMLLKRSRKTLKHVSGCRVKTITGDLNTLSTIKRDIIDFNPDILIHLAWEGIPDFSFSLSRKNLDNSIKLINLITQKTDCRKIIISGSCLEYGKTKGICREADEVRINSYFAWAKHSLYQYAHLVCEEKKIDLVWFRIFYVYGPGQREGALIPGLVQSFRQNTALSLEDPFNANDFVCVLDVVKAFNLSVEKKIKTGIYNLGRGHSTRVIDICKLVEKQIRESVDISKKLESSSHTTTGHSDFWADIDKSKKAFSWAPEISIQRGIKNNLDH
jgi:nucleoside-diphosphate-sugar epimerase